jgi:hypothetical protein
MILQRSGGAAAVIGVTRRTTYRVAGGSLRVETHGRWAAEVVAAQFAGWYLAPVEAPAAPEAPPIVVRSDVAPPAIPTGSAAFDVAGGGVCHVHGGASYICLEGSVVATGHAGRPAIDVWLAGVLPRDSVTLTRLIAYALSAALRRQRRFELHSSAVVDPETGRGVLMAGPSGSGKSTMTVHLATAGWPYLTDDVLLLAPEPGAVAAWPLRRCFAITAETFATSRYLQAQPAACVDATLPGEKQGFLPHHVFAGAFRERCVPATIVFPELTGAPRSEAVRLSAGDTMARLIRLSPWSCYDRATAPAHLAMLSSLARQATGWSLRAGRDLLDPEASARAIAACARP